MQRYVYLSGPIAHLSYGEANAWREEAAAAFLPDIIGINPLRGKEVLAGVGVLDGSHNAKMIAANGEQPFYRDHELLGRDHHDVINADALLVNLLGTTKVSIGTVAELAWAYDRHIKVGLIMEETGNPHDHPFIRAMCHFRTPTLAGGIHIINALLGPYATV